MPNMTRRVDISYKTVFFITAFLLSLWVLYLIRDIILLVFIAFILMSALASPVDRLVKFKVPRPIAIFLIFLLLFLVLIATLGVGFTPLIRQTNSLSQKLAEALSGLLKANFVDQTIIQRELSNLSSNIINFTVNVFESLIAFVSVIVITFYLLLDREMLESRATTLFINRQDQVKKLLRKIEDKLGAWLRGQLVLSVLVGAMVYVGLLILGVEFALPLAIIAGILEVVPVIGPIIAAIPAVLITLTVSPILAGIVAGLYLAIQQVEGHVIVPQVMKRAVGLNPLLVILAVTVGGRLLGVAGALLAVPIVVVIEVILQEVLKPTTPP